MKAVEACICNCVKVAKHIKPSSKPCTTGGLAEDCCDWWQAHLGYFSTCVDAGVIPAGRWIVVCLCKLLPAAPAGIGGGDSCCHAAAAAAGNRCRCSSPLQPLGFCKPCRCWQAGKRQPNDDFGLHVGCCRDPQVSSLAGSWEAVQRRCDAGVKLSMPAGEECVLR